MENNESRFLSKDGLKRVTIYRECCIESPRGMTDEPLHCEDWSRNYSIMTSEDDMYRFSCVRDRIESFLGCYGDRKKIISLLKEGSEENRLVWDRTKRWWTLLGKSLVSGNWVECDIFSCKQEDIDIYDLLASINDRTIDYLVEQGCIGNGVKYASYSFGYDGEVTFYDNSLSTKSDGVAWLFRGEFLKYSGCDESYWDSKSFLEIELVAKEIMDYSRGDVYSFVVEECEKSIIRKTYINSDKEDEVYENEEWIITESCTGFYGDINAVEESIFDAAGLDRNDFEEVNN